MKLNLTLKISKKSINPELELSFKIWRVKY